jgi:tRNA (cmo5U34)-methyltransferase
MLEECIKEISFEVMGQFHFTPDDYLDLMQAEVPDYEELQERVVTATEGRSVSRILELGTGTGETSRRVLARHKEARLTGIDESAGMLAAARATLPSERVDDLILRGIEEPLPGGPFDLVISALTVHHLDGPDKADLFARVARVLRPGGLFVMADVVEPEDPADAVTPLTPDYDMPDRVDDLLTWLGAAGFEATIEWSAKDLAVIRSEFPSRRRDPGVERMNT